MYLSRSVGCEPAKCFGCENGCVTTVETAVVGVVNNVGGLGAHPKYFDEASVPNYLRFIVDSGRMLQQM